MIIEKKQRIGRVFLSFLKTENLPLFPKNQKKKKENYFEDLSTDFILILGSFKY